MRGDATHADSPIIYSDEMYSVRLRFSFYF
jgi:hypothetical protein